MVRTEPTATIHDWMLSSHESELTKRSSLKSPTIMLVILEVVD